MTQSIEKWSDSSQSLAVASAILAASLGSNPGIPIVPRQNAIDFLHDKQEPSLSNFYKNHSAYNYFYL